MNRYLRENLGSIPILAFLGLSTAAAVLAQVGYRPVANEFAIYGFYLLVTGVVASIYSIARSAKRLSLDHTTESN